MSKMTGVFGWLADTLIHADLGSLDLSDYKCI